MKDYEHMVVWLDYFNKNLPRSAGRRLGREQCVFDPTLKELADAARASGLEVTESAEGAKFPRRPYVKSGYLVIPKVPPKSGMLSKISAQLVAIRAKHQKSK